MTRVPIDFIYTTYWKRFIKEIHQDDVVGLPTCVQQCIKYIWHTYSQSFINLLEVHVALIHNRMHHWNGTKVTVPILMFKACHDFRIPSPHTVCQTAEGARLTLSMSIWVYTWAICTVHIVLDNHLHLF
jgi:hypothetical protein